MELEQTAETVLDYTPLLEDLQSLVNSGNAMTGEYLRYILGVLLFFVIVVICHYGYKFLKLFF